MLNKENCITFFYHHAKCNSGLIAMQWFRIKHCLDCQYTKFQLHWSVINYQGTCEWHSVRGFETSIHTMAMVDRRVAS